MVDYAPTLIPLPGLAQGASPSTSPVALKAQRDYANALLYGKMQQPVQHWTQGASNMVNALMGGLMQKNANEREDAGDARAGDRMTVPLNPPAGGAAPTSFTEGPSSEGQGNSGGGSEMAARKAATASIESGSPEGNYNAIGPVVKTGAYAGDRAFGKYQVMGKNVTAWTKEVFGQSMTPEQFLKNPQAQEAIFEAKSTRDPRDWFGHGKSDGYMSGANYEKKYAEGLSKYGGGQPAMAFSGAPSEGGGPAAIAAAALRGKPLTGPERPSPVAGEKPLIDPALAPQVPQISQNQIRGIMSDPRIPWEQKMQMQALYLQQQQIVEVPYPGGKVRVDPRNPSRQQFVPDLQKGEVSIDGIKMPSFGTITPDTKYRPSEEVTPPAVTGPRSDAAPAVAPSGAPQGGPVPTPASVVAAAQPVPLPTPRPPEAGAPAPVQVASLDPTAGVGSAVEPPLTPREQEMMALVKPGAAATPAAPPIVPPPPKQEEVAQAPATGPLSQVVAQNKAPAGIPQRIWDAHLQSMQVKTDNEVNKAAREKNNELSAKRYEDMLARSDSATEQRKNVATAMAQLNNKEFYAGLASGAVETWKQFKVALGIDPNASAPMEIFRKTTAQSIMSGLKTAFGGLGQIRVAEIELQKVANASTNNSPAAIRALLTITDRNAALVQDLGDMTTAYKSGQAVMDPRDPTKMLMAANIGPDGQPMERNGLDAKFDRMAQSYAKKHPTFSEKEYNEFEKILKAPGEPDKAEGKPGASLPVEIPPEAVGALKAGKPTTFQNGQVYTLGPDGKPQRLK